MLLVVALYVVLSGQPIICNTAEEKHVFSSNTAINQTIERKSQLKITPLVGSGIITSTIIEPSSTVIVEARHNPVKVADIFTQLAANWEAETRFTSSTKDLILNSNYQEIIGLGWDVMPILLKDLQENHRFWFPALNAITGVRPFDPGDAGNGKRMTEAWIKWGKRKGLI